MNLKTILQVCIIYFYLISKTMEYIKRRPEFSGRFAVLLYYDLVMAAVRFY